MDRRQYLQRLGSAAGLGLAGVTAGCSGDSGSDTPDDSETTTSGSGDDTPDNETTSESDEGTTVSIEGFAFAPVRASIATGTTVEWVNEDSAAHTVVASNLTEEGDDWSFDREVGGGESITHTFDSAGVYEYFCDIHGEGSMCGVVLVGDASLSANLPCESSAEY